MKAWQLLDSPTKWNRGNSARTATGEIVKAKDPNAVCWCVWGAIDRCYPSDEREMTTRICKHLNMMYEDDKSVENVDELFAWNDDVNTTYEDVIKVLKHLDI